MSLLVAFSSILTSPLQFNLFLFYLEFQTYRTSLIHARVDVYIETEEESTPFFMAAL